jgi:hypothetical protein
MNQVFKIPFVDGFTWILDADGYRLEERHVVFVKDGEAILRVRLASTFFFEGA